MQEGTDISADSLPALRCTRCKVAQPQDHFTRDKSRASGMFPWCRACSRADKAARYRADPAKHNAGSAEWAKANPDRRRQIWRANATRHRERYNKTKAAWAAANPDKVRDTKLRQRLSGRLERHARMAERRAQHRHERRERAVKCCNRCGLEKGVGEFTVHRPEDAPDRLHPWCKACLNTYRRGHHTELRDSYVRANLAANTGLSASAFPGTLVDAQRAKISLHREITNRRRP